LQGARRRQLRRWDGLGRSAEALRPRRDRHRGACTGESSCSSYGHCVAKGWTCPEASYGGKDDCTCGCGAHDPDCADPANFVADCTVNGCVKDKGICQGCVPSCDGKSCGSDDCGGTCGSCDDAAKPNCTAGQCVEKCTPDCSNKECGDDGCGGTCGSCKKQDQVCSAGFCRAYAANLVPGDTSWAVKQKSEASSVCGCNSKGWQGTGAYYGGKGGGGNNDGCSSWGGGWAGTAGNGVQKGGVNTNTTSFWIR
jgi:hypothetical protein